MQSEKNQLAEESDQAKKRRKIELEKAAEARQKAVEENVRLKRQLKLGKSRVSWGDFRERSPRVLAEMELLAEISSEETSQEFVKQSVQDAELITNAAAIKSRVLEDYRSWLDKGLECALRITLIRDGNVAGLRS